MTAVAMRDGGGGGGGELDALCTPESFVTLSDFDTPEAGFVVRRSCQKRMLNGDVKQKYLVCNRMGCPKGIHVDTLGLENSGKLKRNSNLHITRCKARAVFNLDPRTRRPMKFLSTIIGSLAMLYRLMLPLRQTTINNHRKCVTVAAGLLRNETTKSYIWLLKAFIKAFGKAPSIVVTGQDGAMRNAIEAEFAGSKHRLCMWHITQKLPAMVFLSFSKWGKLMEEFKLENHKWLTKMFNIRSTWIPAYFIDSPLCGLMRTTSRSESENSFFSHFTNSGLTLMNFMNCFEKAMEKQRHVQERMDHNTIDIVPKLKTFLNIERHASNVYTRSLFELVQKEIFVGLWHCQIDSKSLVEGSNVCIIKESQYVYEMSKKKKKTQSVNKVKDKAKENDTIDLFFNKDGLYNNANVEMIPQQYILRRWTKNLIPAALRNKRIRYGEKNVVVENFTNEETLIVDHCVHLLSKDEPRLEEVVVEKEVCQEEVVQEEVDLAEDEEELVEEDEDLIHE
nr:hypothetical protein [Tanacetum cinerariifolium]